jgi:hypothetical protein
MRALKYGTLVVAGRPPFLLYSNPLYRGASGPAEFALHDPLAYAGTLFLHGFAMVDRDLPFTYVTNLEPWYRVPLALANLLLLALAIAGLAASVLRIARRRELDDRGFVALSIALVGAAYLAVYLPVAVEARFGLALQALAPALVVELLASLSGPRKAASRGATVAFATLAVAAGVGLSAWIARQRSNPEELRAALLPPPISPAAPGAPATPAPTPRPAGR